MDFATPVLVAFSILLATCYSACMTVSGILVLLKGQEKVIRGREVKHTFWGLTSILLGCIHFFGVFIICYAPSWLAFGLTVFSCVAFVILRIVRSWSKSNRQTLSARAFSSIFLIVFSLLNIQLLQFMFSLRNYEATW